MLFLAVLGARAPLILVHLSSCRGQVLSRARCWSRADARGAGAARAQGKRFGNWRRVSGVSGHSAARDESTAARVAERGLAASWFVAQLNGSLYKGKVSDPYCPRQIIACSRATHRWLSSLSFISISALAFATSTGSPRERMRLPTDARNALNTALKS